MISRRQIEQYTNYKRELAMIGEQLCAAGEVVTDKVQGSDSEAPYTLHGITVEGYAARRDGRLRKRKAVLEEQCTAVELFVEGLPDSLVRQLFTWRYIEGKSLAETARRVGYSESQTKRLIKSIFKKMTRNDPK